MVSLTKPFNPAPAGNMISGPKPGDETTRVHYIYDAWNRLAAVYDDNGTTLIAKYEYDAAGRRIEKETYSGGSLDEARHYYYGGTWQCIEERVEASGVLPGDADVQYVWGAKYVDNLILRDRDTDADGAMDERLYTLADANYNVTALFDASTGTVVERFVYDAYGNVTELDPDFTTYTGTDYEWEYTYTTRREDAETGLMYYRARYYDADLGRFVSRDPIGYRSGDDNLYRYVQGSPMVYVDPSGLQTVDAHSGTAVPHRTPPADGKYGRPRAITHHEAHHNPVNRVNASGTGDGPTVSGFKNAEFSDWAWFWKGAGIPRSKVEHDYGKITPRVLGLRDLSTTEGVPGHETKTVSKIPDGFLVGSAGSETCIIVIVLKPRLTPGDVVLKYDVVATHLGTQEDPCDVWKKVGGIPSGSRIGIAGGNGSWESNKQLLCVVASVAHLKGVTIDGYFNGIGLWVDNLGNYYVHELERRD